MACVNRVTADSCSNESEMKRQLMKIISVCNGVSNQAKRKKRNASMAAKRKISKRNENNQQKRNKMA